MPRKSLSGTGPTRHRSIKIPSGLWSEFMSRCQENGTTASDIVRGCVESYVWQCADADPDAPFPAVHPVSDSPDNPFAAEGNR